MSRMLRLPTMEALDALRARSTVRNNVVMGDATPKPFRKVKQPSQGEFELPLMVKAAGLPTATREHAFHPGRRWRFDFAYPDRKIGIEVEGGIWRQGGGAHSHPLNILRDIEKYNAAAVLGWRILRFTTEDVSNGVAVETIRRALAL